MFPKTYKRSFPAMFILLLLASCIFASKTSFVINDSLPNLKFDFDVCYSFGGGSNADFSEFVAQSFTRPECSQIEMASPGYLYRSNASENTHSCAPGVDNSIAMCVGGYEPCFYDAGNPKSIKFNVRIIPLANGVGSIEKISFSEQAPEFFQFVNSGSLGPNNYPTKYGIRAYVNGGEIFRQIDIPTSRNWNNVEFDFSNIPGFTVSQTTVVSFEILPYCNVGNGALVNAFDIDNLVITGGCNNVKGGFAFTQQETSLCPAQDNSGVITFQVASPRGNNFSWFVADANGTILQIPAAATVDFRVFPNGFYDVYHIAYDGILNGFSVGSNINNLSDCFDLSNPVSVLHSALNGGTLTDPIGFVDAYICSNIFADNQIETVLNSNVGFFTVYLVYDNNGTILNVQSNPNVDFSLFPEGIYFITAASHNGQLFNTIVGENISKLYGCFENSNPLRVIKQFVNGGSISINGSTALEICGSDATNIEPDVTGGLGNNINWVVTNDQGTILNIFDDLPINVSNLNDNPLFINRISFIGRIDGLNINGNLNNVEGCFDLSNQITINIKEISPGTIVLNNTSFCVGDGVADLVDITIVGNVGSFFQHIITNSLGEIIALPTTLPFDVDGSEPGTCIYYFLAADQSVSTPLGTNINDIQGSCFELSAPLSFTRVENFAGRVELAGGVGTEIEVCQGGTTIIQVRNNGEAQAYIYVVTNEQNEIIDLPDANIINANNLPSGVCRVYGIASSNVVNLTIGEELVVPNMIDGCFDISENFVEITKLAFDGGTIELPITEFCIGDGSEVEVSGVVMDAIGTEMQLFLTDDNGDIILILDELPFNIETLAAGTYTLYNLSSRDVFTLMNGTNISEIDGECFDISEGATFTSIFNNGGTVSLEDGSLSVELCVRDTFVNDFNFITTGGGMNYQFIVTDTDNIIISIADTNNIDFENAPAGTCRVWGMAFSETLELQVGEELVEPISLEGCFSLSNNFVEVIRFDAGPVCGDCPAEAGQVILDNNFFCIGDGEADLVTGNVIDADGDFLQIIVTDSDSIIIDLPTEINFDVEDATEGVCIVWSLASVENIDLEIGDNIRDYDASCFELSQGITFTRIENFGGNVSLDDGTTSIEICVEDTLSDLLTFINTGSSAEYQYVITDTDNSILDLPIGDSFDFENAPPGICRVWGMAYNGEFDLDVGDDLVEPADEGECFDLSNNFVEVIRSDSGLICGDCPAEAGQVSLDNTFFCVGDGDADIVTGSVTSASGDFTQIVVTDSDSIVIDLPTEINFDVDTAPAGICIVWSLASTEVINLMVGDNITSYTSSCFELSEGAAITRVNNNGGEVSIIGETSPIEICVGDTTSTVFFFATTGSGTGSGTGYQYVITDTMNVILELPVDSFDFENSPLGTCRLWGLAFSDSLNLIIGETLVEPMVTGECFDLSNNFIEVIKTDSGIACGEIECIVESGTVNLDNTFFCVGDGEPDLVMGNISGASGDFLKIIVTFGDSTVINTFDDFNFDIDGAGAGTCLIWHVASTASIDLNTGDHILDLQNECFDLSESASISRTLNNGGTVSLDGNNTSIEICVSDTIADELIFFTTGSGNNYQFIITDENDVILALPANDTFDFSGSPVGMCRVWGMASSNPLNLNVGQTLVEPESINECFDLSANFIEVIRVDSGVVCGDQPCEVEAGTVTLNQTSFCVGDGEPDLLTGMVENASGDFQQLIITDAASNILALTNGFNFDVDTIPAGTCFVWNLVSDTPITIEVGDNFTAITNDCFELSSATIFTKEFADGAEVNIDGGATSMEICVGDGIPDDITFTNNSTSTLDYIYVVTDANNIVLALPSDDNFDFDSLDEGTCRVWGVSLSGSSDLIIGNDLLQTIISTGCFDISDNFVEVVKFESGGPCQSIMDACEEEDQDCDPTDLFLIYSDTTIVPGSNVCIPLTVLNFTDIATLQGGIMWDPTILNFTSIENIAVQGMSNSSFNIDTLNGTGSFIWFDSAGGANAQTIPDGGVFFELCFEVIGEDNERGLIEIVDTGMPQLQFSNSQGQVLDVCTDAGCVDAQDSNFTLIADSVITSDTSVCVDFPALNFTEMSGIQYTIEWDSTFMCLDSIINFNQPAFILPNSFNQVNAQKIRFVWTGNSITLPNDDLLYTMCFNVKDNSCGSSSAINFIDDTNVNIEIISGNMEIPFDIIPGSVEYLSDGGDIALADGTTAITICAGDLESDNLLFINSSMSADNYTYVITDTNNTILDVLASNNFDFEAAPSSVYRVWGISHFGSFNLFPGDVLEDLISDDCFDQSANFIEVTVVSSGPPCNSPELISFAIAPNPASENINIKISKMPIEGGEMSIVNSVGQVFYSSTIENLSDPIFNLDISQFPEGIYFINLRVDDKLLTKRFMVIGF